MKPTVAFRALFLIAPPPLLLVAAAGGPIDETANWPALRGRERRGRMYIRTLEHLWAIGSEN